MNVFILMVPILLIVLSGYFSAKLKLFSEESNNTFTRFTFFIAMPCQLFFDFSHTPVSQAFNIHYIAAFALTLCITGSFIFFYTRKYLKASLAESALNVMGSSQVNTAYFAIPLFILVFNNPTPVIPILIFQVTIVTTIILLLIEHDVSPKKQKGRLRLVLNILKIACTTPIIVASLLGVLFSLLHWSLPSFGSKFLGIFGATAAPLALFALGQSLYFDLRKIAKKDLFELSLLSLSKLFISPLLAFLIGKYLFHLGHFWLASLTIMAAMPAPKNMFIFAVKYHLNVKKASAIVALTTLMSFITLNILMMVFRSYM
jgi:malonate transporter and related proteins